MDGVGPTREFVIDVPADANGTYQGAAQRNAEAVYDITWGEDVMPEINGTYYIISKANGRAVQAPSSATATAMSHGSMNATSTRQKWEIKKVRTDNGGDYSYFTIADANNTDRGWFLEGWKLSEDYSSTSDQFSRLPFFAPTVMDIFRMALKQSISLIIASGISSMPAMDGSASAAR